MSQLFYSKVKKKGHPSECYGCARIRT